MAQIFLHCATEINWLRQYLIVCWKGVHNIVETKFGGDKIQKDASLDKYENKRKRIDGNIEQYDARDLISLYLILHYFVHSILRHYTFFRNFMSYHKSFMQNLTTYCGKIMHELVHKIYLLKKRNGISFKVSMQ